MSKEVILVIDDEPQIQKLLEITLESNQYKVIQANTAKSGIALAANHGPDLILLDLGLPDMSGHEVLVELKKWYAKSIIILTAVTTEFDIVNALDHGATDYLTKPFRSAELLARIRSALRRNHANHGNSVVTSGDLSLDFAARLVRVNNEIVKLTTTEYNILSFLMQNEGRVLTHAQLLKEVWGVGSQNETQYLRVFIRTIRKKIERNPNKPVHILTESGVGYRFI